MTARDSFGAGPTGLYRDPANGKLYGVCAGLADYFGADVMAVRAAVVLLAIFGFFGPVFVGYVILAVLLQKKPPRLFRDADEETFWRSVARHPPQAASGLSRRFRELDGRLIRLERRLTSPDEALRAKFRDLSS